MTRVHDSAFTIVTEHTAELERLVETISAEEIPDLLGNLERLKARLWTRMNEATRPVAATPARKAPDRLLTAKEAAEILGVKTRWLYFHADKVPGMQRLSRRCLRFSERKLRRWMEQRNP